MKGDRGYSLGITMTDSHDTHSHDKAETHLETAKEEVKSAASELMDEAKDKIHGAVDAVQDKVIEAVDKVHAAAHKDEMKN